MAIAIAFFAFTTVLAYYYMAETNLSYFNRWIKNAGARRALVCVLRVLEVGHRDVHAAAKPGEAREAHVFGDETALPAIARILDEWPDGPRRAGTRCRGRIRRRSVGR